MTEWPASKVNYLVLSFVIMNWREELDTADLLPTEKNDQVFSIFKRS